MAYTDRETAAAKILADLHNYDSMTDAARALQELTGDEFPRLEGARGFLRREKDKAAQGEDAPQSSAKTEFTENPDKGTGSFSFKGEVDKPMTLDELIATHGVDLEVWKVDRVKIGSWGVTSKLGTGDEAYLQAAKNYNISVTLVRREDNAADILESKADAIIAAVGRERGAARKTPIQDKIDVSAKGRMLEVSIFDLHMGKMAWSEETGGADWDSKIAASECLAAARDLLEFFPSYERIWLPLGHDFFNVDTVQGTTTRGTPQHDDVRWAKSIDLGCDLAIELVEMCAQYAPVDVTIMPGNHDEQRCHFLGRVLDERYRTIDDVTVDRAAGTVKAKRWGNNLLVTAHGHEGKPEKMITEIAMRWPKDFAETKHREIHTGHGHRMKNMGLTVEGFEEQEVRWRMIPSLCAPDSWHARNLYRNKAAAECYLWHAEDTYLGHHSYNRP